MAVHAEAEGGVAAGEGDAGAASGAAEQHVAAIFMQHCSTHGKGGGSASFQGTSIGKTAVGVRRDDVDDSVGRGSWVGREAGWEGCGIDWCR